MGLALAGCATNSSDTAMPEMTMASCAPAVFSLFFDTGDAELTPSSKQVLDNATAAVSGCNVSYIEIEGHADSVGTSPANMKLSDDRAMSVFSMLTDNNITAELIRIIPLGETEAVQTETPNQADRKTIVRIIS